MESVRRKRRIYEHFVGVYLDADIQFIDEKELIGDTTFGYEATKFFYNADQCIDYITNLQNRRVHLILSASMGEYLLPLIYLLPQILCIYIHVKKVEDLQQYEKVFEPYRMIVQTISHQMNAICEQMGKDIEDSTSYSGMKLLNQAKGSSITTNDDATDIHYEQEPEFLYGQLLKESLLQLPSSADSRRELIEFCRSKYSNNQTQLDLIKQFEENYSKAKAFWWYSKDSFLYRLINQALREQDITALYNLRFFLRDLHECISGYHSRFLQTSLNIRSLKVYRGLAMPTEHFSTLKEKIGGLLSFNSFLSTSQNMTIGISFAVPYVGLPDKVPVLFQIDVDSFHCRTSFADIRRESEIKGEEEVLFTMGTVFRLISMELMEEWNIWKLNLQLTDDEDEKLGYLLLYRRKELFRESSNPEKNFVNLVMHLQQWTFAEKICLQILDQPSTNIDINHTLGRISAQRGEYDKAIEYYQKALQASSETDASPIYSSLAQIYLDEEDYSKALSYQNLALELYLRRPIQCDYDLVRYYNDIAGIHNRAQNHHLALEFFEKSLQLLKIDDPFRGNIYNNMAVLYHSLENYEKAIEYCHKTLAILTRSLPAYHVNFASAYSNLAMSLYQQHDLEQAAEYMEKAYKIREKDPSADQCLTLEYLQWTMRINEKLCE